MRPKYSLKKLKPLLSASSFTSAQARALGDEKIDLDKILRYAKILRVKIEPFLLAMTL